MIQCIRLQTTGLLWLRLLLLLSSYPGKLACFDRGATDLFANCMAWVMGILSALCRCGSVNEDNNNQCSDKEDNNNKERFAHNLHGFVLVLSAGVDLLLWEELSHHWPHISICIIVPLPMPPPHMYYCRTPSPFDWMQQGAGTCFGCWEVFLGGEADWEPKDWNLETLQVWWFFQGGYWKQSIDWVYHIDSSYCLLTRIRTCAACLSINFYLQFFDAYICRF